MEKLNITQINAANSLLSNYVNHCLECTDDPKYQHNRLAKFYTSGKVGYCLAALYKHVVKHPLIPFISQTVALSSAANEMVDNYEQAAHLIIQQFF